MRCNTLKERFKGLVLFDSERNQIGRLSNSFLNNVKGWFNLVMSCSRMWDCNACKYHRVALC